MKSKRSSGQQLKYILKLVGNDLRNSFERSAEIRHRGERGRIREQQLLEFVKQRIPDAYDVATGQVIDSFNNASRQVDGIVYNKASSPLLYAETWPSDRLQPSVLCIESVAAVIAVKSYLNGSQLKDAFANIESAKALRKEGEFGRPRRIAQGKGRGRWR